MYARGASVIGPCLVRARWPRRCSSAAEGAHSFALALTSLVLLAAASGACGQDVATCSTICAFNDAPPTCTNDCSDVENACSGAGYGGAFQALLTCQANAGSYLSEQTVCLSQYDLVTSSCEPASSPSPVGTGSSPGSSGSSGGSASGSGVTCAELHVCCEQSPSTGTACEEIANAGDDAACETALQGFFSSGACDVSLAGGDAGVIVVDATTGPEDAGVSAVGCALGAPCPEGTPTCFNPGAGPCASDQRLACSNGVYVADGFPCNANVSSCGFGSGTCNESCTCTNGLMVCEGDCPDAGPGSP